VKISLSFWRSKTTWTALAAVCTAIAGAVHGDMSPLTAIFASLAALLPAFLRDTNARGWEALLAALEGMGQADGGEVKP
jgi:hypothetical protein